MGAIAFSYNGIYLVHRTAVVYRMCSRVTKRPVKKSYRVRRAVDNSMRYFDASYLLGDDDEDDDSYDKNDPRPAKSSSCPLQRQTSMTDAQRIGSVRSTAGFKQNHESAIHSEDFDDVTNIKR